MKYKFNDCKILIFMLLICSTKFHCASSQCNDEEWKCDDGQCINEDDKCNGMINCRDGSDEIAENCIHLWPKCQQNAFRCHYGGCIAGVSQCDNKTDCADNSDELNCPWVNVPNLQGECQSEDEMQCLVTKQCIDGGKVCNGIKDCSDGSDESVQVCYRYVCTSSVSFQCGYGACIADLKCDGNRDCADGSDEAWELCDTRRKINNLGFTPPPPPIVTPRSPVRPPAPPANTNPVKGKGCQIQNTPQTQRMRIKLHPSNNTISLGTYVENFEIIHIECNNGLGRRGLATLLCRNDNWNDDFPTCVDYCDASDIQGLSTRAICDPEGDYHPCKKKIPPNTAIQINCKNGFTSDNPTQRIRCLPNGTFSNKRQPCTLNCGRVASSADILSKGGIPTKPSKVPWNVAIYERGIDYTYICSGSIVSPRVVISAAHCFYDHSNSVKKNESVFQVIAGKFLRDYTTNTNENKQNSDVAQVFIPPDYKGNSNGFYNDIAFLILNTPLEYNQNISSICIPSPRELKPGGNNYVISKLSGLITGFGSNNQLERLNMVTKNYHECNAISPIAQDKFCILNHDGASVCRGESGGGFVRESKDDFNDNLYKLLGVISNTPGTTNDCTREGSHVAVTSMSYLPDTFVQQLFKAIRDDESKY